MIEYLAKSILLKFVPDGSIENKSALVQVMASRLISDKPLHEQMLTQIYEAIGCHKATMSSTRSTLNNEKGKERNYPVFCSFGNIKHFMLVLAMMMCK